MATEIISKYSASPPHTRVWHLEQAPVEIAPVYRFAICWMLLLSLIFFAVHGVFSFQTAGASTADSGSLGGLAPARSTGIVDYVVLPGIAYGIVMYMLVTHFGMVFEAARQMRALTALAALTMVSALWSQAPFRSTYNGVFYLVGTLFAFFLVSRFSTKQLMDLLMLAGVIICIADILLVALFPDIGIASVLGRSAGAWRGIFMDRTSAAKCLTYLLSPALVFGYRRMTVTRVAYILLLAASIYMSHAVSALLVTAAYGVFMALFALTRRMQFKSVIGLGLLTVTLAVTMLALALPFAADILALFGRDLTLTGRTTVWTALIPSIAKHPLLGYGFYAFWLGLTGESANIIVTTHWLFGYAHNGFLEIVLQLGFVGLTVFAITLFQAIRNIFSCMQSRRSIGVDWYIGLIVLTLLYNMDEETILWPNDLLSILYVMACFGLSVAARRVNALTAEPMRAEATQPALAIPD